MTVLYEISRVCETESALGSLIDFVLQFGIVSKERGFVERGIVSKV